MLRIAPPLLERDMPDWTKRDLENTLRHRGGLNLLFVEVDVYDTYSEFHCAVDRTGMGQIKLEDVEQDCIRYYLQAVLRAKGELARYTGFRIDDIYKILYIDSIDPRKNQPETPPAYSDIL